MSRLINKMFLCLSVLATLSACETIPQEPKSITVSTSQTNETILPIMTPIPNQQQFGPQYVIPCEKFMSSMDLAEQKIAEENSRRTSLQNPIASLTMADAI